MTRRREGGRSYRLSRAMTPLDMYSREGATEKTEESMIVSLLLMASCECFRGGTASDEIKADGWREKGRKCQVKSKSERERRSFAWFAQS